MSATWEVFDLVEQSFLSETSPLVVLTHVHVRSRATGRDRGGLHELPFR
ncbi:hypothetical protein [Amycolatopsis thailandensis]|nr:hypothetical protein [Amycolatopsis thailandensis]